MTIHQTRTEATEQAYLKRAGLLLRRAIRESGFDEEQMSAEHFIKWLIGNKPEWSASTWRQNIASCSHAFGNSFICELGKHTLPPSKSKSENTSALKSKKLPPHDLELLGRHLLQKAVNAAERNKHSEMPAASFAANLLFSGYVTGLRPIEWEFAHEGSSHKETDLKIIVRNAKATNGRANGVSRTIHLENVDQKLLNIIRETIQHVQRLKGKGELTTKFRSASRTVNQANRELWPRRKKRYTLYSARHQAAANWKLSFSKEEVAALMGHCSARTASEHYGRRSAGRAHIFPGRLAVCLPTPNPAEVATVKPSRDSSAHRSAPTMI